MDQLFIDAIEQNPTAGYLTEFRQEAEKMGVRHSADLDNLGKRNLRTLASVVANEGSYYLTAPSQTTSSSSYQSGGR
ncbi:hypothetical protein E4U45_000279 [Claviceps purpurea]|nr:hypothetical protein E4U45_000279 [Claviceps purpurea]